MAGDVLIGIDLGTTNLKAAAFDAATGRALAEAGERLKERVLHDGGREQSPVAIVRALKAAFAHLRDRLGRRWGSVVGIGLAAQGGSCVICERDSGRALSPMMLWNDLRPLAHLSEIARDYPEPFWSDRTFRKGPPRGLGRIAWLRKHSPALLSDTNIYAGAGEFVFHRLTGVWRQDAGSAIQLGSYNARTRDHDPDLIGAVGMPVSFVAPMRRGHETHSLSRAGARLLGLREGIPVAGPYMDHEAGFLAHQAVSDAPLQASLGTAWVGNYLLPNSAPRTSSSQIVLPSPVGDGSLVVQPLMCGNTTWDWALGAFAHANLPRALEESDAVFRKALLPASALVCLPWVVMPNPLAPELPGAGAFFGIGARTDAPDMLRAAAGGLVCEMARVFDALVSSGLVDAIVLSGGAARGAYFRRMLAALFAPLPIHQSTESDLVGPRGTLHVFSPEAARASSRRMRVPATRIIDAMRAHYERYLAVFEKLYGDPRATGAVQLRAPKKEKTR